MSTMNKPVYQSSSITILAEWLKVAQDCQVAFKALEIELKREFGQTIFTALVMNWSRAENQRIYSSHPLEYPVSGHKPINPSGLVYQAAFVQKSPHVCRTPGDCRAAFFDHDVIAKLGCENAINVPVIDKNVVLGTLNLLGGAGWYQDDFETRLEIYAELAVPLYRKVIAAWNEDASS